MTKRIALSCLIAMTFGLAATSVFATSTPATDAASGQQTSQQTSQVAQKGNAPVVKPGDPTCLQTTGSHIRPAKGHCLPVSGRSYTGQQLRNTGQIDTARALQMLDPSITVNNGW